MTSSEEQIRAYDGPDLFSYGFQPLSHFVSAPILLARRS